MEVAFAVSAGATLGDDPWKVAITSVFPLSFHMPRLQNKMLRNNPWLRRAIGVKCTAADDLEGSSTECFT